ncbi:MAG: hypothetical protein NC340_03480 [Ruminococcus flavefaciens]|nr:hypothetical protein [Ruminococcus flavefaciens]MCM1229616.1 hypothetical protein [Ruminococcus flavefaciens]
MKKIPLLLPLLSVIALCSCSVNIEGINNGSATDFIQKDSETRTVDVKGIDKIEVDIAVGACNITVGDSDEAVMETNCECKGVSKEKVQKAIDNTELRCETKGSTLHIDFINSETGKKIDDSISFLTIITDLEIALPDSFSEFDISTDVGEITINGFSGAFDISSDVGDISAKNLTVTGKSDFSVDVGNINCEIAELSANELELSADVGDVDLSLGRTDKSKIEIKSDVGNISLDTQGKSYEEISSRKDVNEQEKKITVDGNCTVEMEADLGDINITK